MQVVLRDSTAAIDASRACRMFLVKVLTKTHIKKRNEVRHIMSERNVLVLNIKHPFLVGLHYSFQTRDKLYFVLDYLNGGEVCHACSFASLHKLVRK